MARIDQFLANPNEVHTQRLVSETGDQAKGRDFYAIDRAFSENGQINFAPLVRGLSDAAGALQEKAVMDSKIWAHDTAVNGQFEFQKKLAGGADPFTLEKEYTAWQNKIMSEAPSGLAKSMFQRQTDEFGRNLLLSAIRKQTVEREQARIQSFNITMQKELANEYIKIISDEKDLSNLQQRLHITSVGLVDKAEQVGSIPKKMLPNVKMAVKKLLFDIAESAPHKILEADDNVKFSWGLNINDMARLEKKATIFSYKKQMEGGTEQEIEAAYNTSKMIEMDQATHDTITSAYKKSLSELKSDPVLHFSNSKEGKNFEFNLNNIAQQQDSPEKASLYQNLNNQRLEFIKQRQRDSGVAESKLKVMTVQEETKERTKLFDALGTGNIQKISDSVEQLKLRYGQNFDIAFRDIAIDKQSGEMKIPWSIVIAQDAARQPWGKDFADSLNPINYKLKSGSVNDSDLIKYRPTSKFLSVLSNVDSSVSRKVEETILDHAAYLVGVKSIDKESALKISEERIIGSFNHKVSVNGVDMILDNKSYPKEMNWNAMLNSAIKNAVPPVENLAIPQNMGSMFGVNIARNSIVKNSFWQMTNRGNFELFVNAGEAKFPVLTKDGKAVVWKKEDIINSYNSSNTTKKQIENIKAASDVAGMSGF